MYHDKLGKHKLLGQKNFHIAQAYMQLMFAKRCLHQDLSYAV